jgi:hypothetical protein
MAGEGVDIKLKIHPMTAVMIILAVGGASFGLGRISIPEPLIQYIPILATPAPTPLPSPDPWREAAFAGVLQRHGESYYLVGNDTQAIQLVVPDNVAIGKLVGKKILASGKYSPAEFTLQVRLASDLELISGSQPVPTVKPTPLPTP